MKQRATFRHLFKPFSRDERGAVAITLTLYLPFLVGLSTLAVDMSYVLYSRNMLQVTAEAAALAGSSALPNRVDVVDRAVSYAEKNMPKARYKGNPVLKNQDVVLLFWDTKTCNNISCARPADPGGVCQSSSGTTVQCNAVQVTTRLPLDLLFAQMVLDSRIFNVSATAVAVGVPGSQDKWNVAIVQDVSRSFREEIGDAKKADIALLDCIKQDAQAGSKMGITVFAEKVKTVQSITGVETDYQTIKNKINSLDVCGNTMPECGATDVSSGMYSAVDQLCPVKNGKPTCTSNGISGARQAMILVTDGQPNLCKGSNCNPKTESEKAANKAADNGIDVYTIYFGNRDSDADWLAKLVRGKGQAFKTPKASDLADLMVQICRNSVRLVW